MKYDAKAFLAGLFLSASVSCPADLTGDWRMWYEERAGIMEYHGGLPRESAEALALAETVEKMRATTGNGRIESTNPYTTTPHENIVTKERRL